MFLRWIPKGLKVFSDTREGGAAVEPLVKGGEKKPGNRSFRIVKKREVSASTNLKEMEE